MLLPDLCAPGRRRQAGNAVRAHWSAHGQQPLGLSVVHPAIPLGCWEDPRRQRTERHARCLGRGLPAHKLGNYQ
jgi:hypothetical protein